MQNEELLCFDLIVLRNSVLVLPLAASFFEAEARGLPGVEAAEERGCLFEAFVFEEGRHTGARVLGGSSAVGDDEFIPRHLGGALRPIVFGD